MGFDLRIGLLPVGWLAVAACQLAAPLSVQQTAEGLVFSVDDGSGRERCIDAVYVYPNGPPSVEPLWHVQEVQLDACVDTISYGQVPVGFVADGPAPTLQPASNYRVAVAGPGFNEVLDFIAK